MQLDIGATVAALRTLNTHHKVKGFTLKHQAVLTCEHPRGLLTDEEYAPHVAAADARTLDYMSWGRSPVIPTALRCTVTVDGTPVAWILYSGQVQVVERTFDVPRMNTIRDLAREHLGQDPEIQQKLADKRADIDLMSAEAFRHAIGAFRGYAAPGSQMNDYPEGMTVREYNHKYRTPRVGRPGEAGQWNYPPNPTRELTDAERKTWAAKVDRYTEAFRSKYPQDHRAWEFENWWESTRSSRASGEPLELKADERIVIDICRELIPAVVSWPMRTDNDGDEVVDLYIDEPGHGAADDGHKKWVKIWPGRVLRYDDVPEDVRGQWDETWDRLVKRVQDKYADVSHYRYDN